MNKTTFLLWRSALVAGLGGILFGFDVSVIAGTNELMRAEFSLSPAQLGFTVSSAFYGTLTGIVLAGFASTRIGRRDSLKIAALLYLVSAVGCGLSWDWYSLVIFRIIGGLGVGASAVLGPMYIAEISPSHRRGQLVALFQMSIVLGILLAYTSNAIIGTFQFPPPQEWRLKFAGEAVPAIAFFLALFTIPRSPRWLLTRGKNEEAANVLELLGEEDTVEAKNAIAESLQTKKNKRAVDLFQRKYIPSILLAFCVGIFNNLAGINGVLYYLNSIFESAGFSKASGDIQSVAVGVTNLVFTVIAMLCIDRMGRKKLLLIGSLGLAPILFAIAAIYHYQQNEFLLLPLLIAYIAFFAFSQGTVIWVYLSEIFPNAVREKGLTLGSFVAWTAGTIVAWFFPIMTDYAASFPFIVFGISMIIQFVLVWKYFPETKGVPLERIEQMVTFPDRS